MKALVGAFNQEKTLVGAFFVIVKTDYGTDGSFYRTVTSSSKELSPPPCHPLQETETTDVMRPEKMFVVHDIFLTLITDPTIYLIYILQWQ